MEGVYISDDCTVEEGVEICAPAYISGASHLCRGARILPYSYIHNSYVGPNAVVICSTLINSHMSGGSTLGPYAYLRCGAYVGQNCRIGDFVEIKNSRLGNGVKAAHLAYVGDAEVGDGVNIGCGVVFCNYNGKTKGKIVVGKGAFIGANCNLVAPLTIGEGAYIAAGSTVTCDIGEGDFCVARQREYIKKGGARGRYS